MKIYRIHITALLLIVQYGNAQQSNSDKKEILHIIDTYTKNVIERDSVGFYNLFNDEAVVWCGAITDRSQQRLIAQKGIKKAGSNYFTGGYKNFMRSLFKYKTTEDKFYNIKIVEDGTVAAVTMDYSFWANNKMTNWGSKYLALIKRDGKWKITSVIYSLELISYFEQPSINTRKKEKKRNYKIRQ